MGYVVHFYHMGSVVYCDTPDQVELCKVLKNTPWFVVFETSEQQQAGTEIADWAWLKELELNGITKRVVAWT